MKKNVMMRAASTLLVAVLLTTCAISGTFAKYTTSATGTDSARVAYWGFKQPASLNLKLFDEKYQNPSNTSYTVVASGNDNVIAPGTEKTATISFAFTGSTGISAPEVAYEIKVEATANTEPNDYKALDDNPNFKWTLKSAAPDATTQEFNTVADLLNAIKGLSGDSSGTKYYDPGSLPTQLNGNVKIGWKWDFNTDDKADTTDKNEESVQDAIDTSMGNAENLDDVTITITITATQKD